MTLLRPALAALVLLAASLPASLAALAAEPVFPPGSRIGVAPPADMTPSKRFTGFENPGRSAALTLIEMPPEAYAQVAAGFTPEALRGQGITLKSREEVKVSGRDGVLISGEQTVGGTALRKWILLAGDPTVTAFVIAQAPAGGDTYSEEEMRGALTSVALRAPLSLDDQIAALPFKVPERAGFRPVRVMAGNSLLLTDGPKDVVREHEQPLLILAQSVAPAPPPEARDQLARAALFSNPTMADLRIERSQGFRQRGADWHEIVARGKDKDSDQALVVTQTIRFTSGGFLRMVGITRAENRDRDLSRFRQVIDGVEVE